MKQLNLAELKIGEVATIHSFDDENLPSRLCELGIVPGTVIQIQFTGPNFDPICIAFDKAKSKIALRKSEALRIKVIR